MMLNTSAFLGMDLIWWIVFIALMIWIFIIPFDIPGQRNKRDSPLDILKKRFASGKITAEEYKRDCNLLKGDPVNSPHLDK